jgi:hypothetical protein
MIFLNEPVGTGMRSGICYTNGADGNRQVAACTLTPE